ncbi:uncharacterized protein BDZ83DRAFT_572747 [Colletotrichum acutatum]|uniref:Uncharacterized protein n=1 Tax=Glomerella acutata TaxID=27357 RepID=A0AAD8XJS3_GLOAC|nr:uncharacterized protein BDZ83DRAFT_572747 [Colletotrichum acutatum]KAK1727380.1 hypothetical protein BDZ83DRAFT_572747 [Colletotrichum acutatum]
MSSSLARTRSLRKPTQGSSTDLPPTTTTTSVSSSASITAARGPASSTTGAAAPSASTSHRPVSPSRLPAPRSLAATRPTTRTVSGASVASSTAAAATTASEAPKKKRPNPLSSLLSRSSSTLLRPAFSTLQQHYSPAKSLAPKPLTATYLAAPSPSKLPANIALTAETARLQTELLQLHLLHRDLPQVTSQWHATARSKLAARHADLAASARGLATLESDAAEHRNIAALRNWGATPSTGGKTSFLPLEDRIQRLDALLTSLWSLDSPGGKHHRLVRAFERWASSLADLEAARARAEDGADPSALLDDNADVRFGGGLDARWKDDAAALVRRLEGWDAQLRELEYRGDDDEDVAAGAGTDTTTQASSLKRMLDGCASLVKDMLDELAVMEDIEAAAVERENEWIKRMNREGDDGRGRDTQRAGAIWRVI